MNYKNKKILVVGLKASGVSVATLLQREGANVVCFDDNGVYDFGNLCVVHEITPELVSSCDLVVPSPSIPPTHPSIRFAKQFHVKIWGELEIACSFLPCKKIMVTGTNGKTSVVTMIERLLSGAGKKAKAMGNIGYPVSQVILDGTVPDYAVIEVSSFQLEYIEKLKPDIAVVLNLSPDHMDRYKDFYDYVATKQKILINSGAKDYFVFNCEDGNVRRFLPFSKGKNIPVGLQYKDSPVRIKENYYMLQDETVCSVKSSKIRGEHNKFNLLIAMNVGYLCGCKSTHLAKLVREYTLLPNRIEYVLTRNGVSFYNDSKGTNIHACESAVKAMEGNVGLIMGGSSKNEDFCDFFENIDSKVKHIAITGDNADKIYNSAMKMGYTDIAIFDTLFGAVSYLYRKEGITTVLLSPASASFDRYKNYAERGEKFKEAVYALQK